MIELRRFVAIAGSINEGMKNQYVFKTFIVAFDFEDMFFLSVMMKNRMWLAIWEAGH